MQSTVEQNNSYQLIMQSPFALNNGWQNYYHVTQNNGLQYYYQGAQNNGSQYLYQVAQNTPDTTPAQPAKIKSLDHGGDFQQPIFDRKKIRVDNSILESADQLKYEENFVKLETSFSSLKYWVIVQGEDIVTPELLKADLFDKLVYIEKRIGVLPERIEIVDDVYKNEIRKMVMASFHNYSDYRTALANCTLKAFVKDNASTVCIRGGVGIKLYYKYMNIKLLTQQLDATPRQIKIVRHGRLGKNGKTFIIPSNILLLKDFVNNGFEFLGEHRFPDFELSGKISIVLMKDGEEKDRAILKRQTRVFEIIQCQKRQAGAKKQLKLQEKKDKLLNLEILKKN